MQPPVPDLSAFPLWAQVLMYGILGVAIAITFVFTWLGFIKGKSNTTTNSSTNAAQVAAVIVDPTALLKAVDAVRGLSDRVDDLSDAIKEMTKEMIRNAHR